MTEQIPTQINRPGQNGNPLLEDVHTKKQFDKHGLDDPNGQRLAAALNKEAFGKTYVHGQVAEIIKFAPDEDKQGLRKELGGALLRNTLNASQAEIFAHAGKQEFETAIEERQNYLSQVNGTRKERREAKRAHMKAYDAENIGLHQGATALAGAQAEAIQAERADFQKQLVQDETKRAA